jgi:serine phosphatase RsbU (regulator of sigma subunit)
VKIALRTLAARRLSIAEMLRELDATFLDNLLPASYFTLFYGVLDPGGRPMVYANAGRRRSPPPCTRPSTRSAGRVAYE